MSDQHEALFRELIDASRSELDPSRADRARLESGFAKIAGPVILATMIPTGSAAAAPVAAAAAGGGGMIKLLGLLSIIAATGAGIGYAVHTRAPSPPSTAPSAREQVSPPPPPVETASVPPDLIAIPIVAPDPTAPPRPAALPRASAQPADANALGEEFALISKAQAALNAHDPAAALTLLDSHASRYPKGQLAEEREVLRVIAGCTIGRSDARAKAKTFLKNRPQSPHAARIRKVCDNG